MFHLRVFDAATGEHIGNLADISPQGLMITGEHELPRGQRLSLEMRVPIGRRGGERLFFRATVVWSSNDVWVGLYDSGLANLEIDDARRVILEKMIEEYGIPETAVN